RGNRSSSATSLSPPSGWRSSLTRRPLGRSPSAALAAQRPTDHLVEQAGADVAVPLDAVRAGRDLAEIEADDGPPAFHHAGDQRAGLVEVEPAGNRRAGVGAEAGVEPVDVAGEVDALRQVLADALHLLLPGRAAEALVRQVTIEVGDDAAGVSPDV